MLDKILPIVVQAVAVAGGVVGGLMLKAPPQAPQKDPATHEQAAADGHGDKKKKDHGKKKDSHGDKDKKKKNKKKKKDKGHGKADDHGDGGDGGSSSFLKFSRQFIIPILNKSGDNYVVMMDINIEMPSGATQSTYEKEPKLRDGLLRALFTMSNEGMFGEGLLVESNMNELREELLIAARDIIGDDAKDILILNIAKQRV